VQDVRLVMLEAMARTRKVRLRGQDHDVGDIIDRAVEEVGPQLLRAVERQIRDAAEMEQVVVVGGGASLMYPLIKDKYPHAVVADDPEFANARGMMKYVQHLRG